MIFGIGTDIVSVERIREGLERHGDRFAQRILGESEMGGFHNSNYPDRFLAKRFAAKEAVVKAMGTGFRDGISMKHITISHDELGKPLVILSAKALEIADEKGIGESHISLSDEKDYVVAFATLLKK